MPERLVDIKRDDRTLHTFPVTLPPAAGADDEAFKVKALEAATHARVVPTGERGSLHADMHVDRSGPLEAQSDPLGAMAETREGLEQVVRERAFLAWEQAGRPEGRADDFWFQAQHQRCCERAYALWEAEGRPEGTAEEYWYRTRNFESA